LKSLKFHYLHEKVEILKKIITEISVKLFEISFFSSIFLFTIVQCATVER